MKRQTMLLGTSFLILFSCIAFSDELTQSYVLSLPAQILPPAVPKDNPLTKGKVLLGRKLYFDKRLSADDSVSCATCHHPDHGFCDGKVVAEGINGKKGARNSPTTLNAAFYDLQFWDGRAEALEDQAKGPMLNPVEMGMPSHDAVVHKLRGIEEYSDLFHKIFKTKEFTIDHVAQAIAPFERTLVTSHSPFDRFISGNTKAISDSAQRGWGLFLGKARCNICHTFVPNRPFFTDNKFHNIGVGAKHARFGELIRQAEKEQDIAKLSHKEGASELGRFLVTKKTQDIGAFKTSALKDIALTAPYMHDGSESTLESVIKFYNKGGEPNKYLDKEIKPLNLTKDEVRDIVEFLKALTTEESARLQKEFAKDVK